MLNQKSSRFRFTGGWICVGDEKEGGGVLSKGIHSKGRMDTFTVWDGMGDIHIHGGGQHSLYGIETFMGKGGEVGNRCCWWMVM